MAPITTEDLPGASPGACPVRANSTKSPRPFGHARIVPPRADQAPKATNAMPAEEPAAAQRAPRRRAVHRRAGHLRDAAHLATAASPISSAPAKPVSVNAATPTPRACAASRVARMRSGRSRGSREAVTHHACRMFHATNEARSLVQGEGSGPVPSHRAGRSHALCAAASPLPAKDASSARLAASRGGVAGAAAPARGAVGGLIQRGWSPPHGRPREWHVARLSVPWRPRHRRRCC